MLNIIIGILLIIGAVISVLISVNKTPQNLKGVLLEVLLVYCVSRNRSWYVRYDNGNYPSTIKKLRTCG